MRESGTLMPCFRSTTLISTLDFAARLRPTLHTSDGSEGNFFPGPRISKDTKTLQNFSPAPLFAFPGPHPVFSRRIIPAFHERA